MTMKNDEQIENDESEKVIILTASGKGEPENQRLLLLPQRRIQRLLFWIPMMPQNLLFNIWLTAALYRFRF